MPRKNPLEKKCKLCGETYQTYTSLRQYCSPECAYKSRNRKGRIVACTKCGKEFYLRPGITKNKNYCSSKCFGDQLKTNTTLKCKGCGKEYYRARSQIRWRGSSYCSMECKNSPRGLEKYKTRVVDAIFARIVKHQAKWRCIKCKQDFSDKKRLLHASHFWGRNHAGTRFDFKNVDALCYRHHYGDKVHGWEYNKQGEYREFMIKKLGDDGYLELQRRAIAIYPLEAAKKEFMEWYKAHHGELKKKYGDL